MIHEDSLFLSVSRGCRDQRYLLSGLMIPKISLGAKKTTTLETVKILNITSLVIFLTCFCVPSAAPSARWI